MSARRRILIATAALALAVPTVAMAAPNPINDRFQRTGTSGPVSSTFRPGVLNTNAKVNVMVQLKGDPVAVAEAKAKRSFSTADRNKVKRTLRNAQDAITGQIEARGGKVMSHLQSAYNGMRVQISAKKAASLSSLPGVVAVHTITPRTLDNTVSVPYLGVPQAWQSTGYTGKGVKVGIIDTGIDYTHADFAGPGTVAAFDAAAATSTAPADPALFGPAAPRVKGGYDFVGDDYDANAVGTPAATPHPDPNPLDCGGHGSHVAGTTGGSGVTADGKTYAGPYNAATPSKSFKVGPGVAPQVDLYALRVFGCEGSTDVVTEAIDWAVDHQLDVINMSLGSPFGRSDSPDAVAASNAVAAGVVVVASAGNSGPSPYIAGAPGVGEGVLAVSAVDSTASFPGAKLTLSGKTLDAINANGADLPTGPFSIVRLVDDANTDENEALGCSVKAFTDAITGASPPGKVIAVVDRGNCARIAKAVYGQQAGADAVVMVNNAADLPPFEGPITINPDDNMPYEVTIPFLGVTQADGPVLAGAAGGTLSMSAFTLPNPGFEHYASFSSSGPETGDSGLSPNVAAPGVSIASAGVGTGSDAAIMSGTSMAAPHVTGVAALGVQAHPTWSAQAVAAAVSNTADPVKVKGYSVTLGGALVDAAQTVKTQTFVTGDTFRTASGKASEATLSFGFAEPLQAFFGTRYLTIANQGKKAATYTLAAAPAKDSVDSTLRFSSRKVRVPAGGKAKVAVTLIVRASKLTSSLAAPPFGFQAASGSVTVTSSDGTLQVPYLLVPRAQADVTATTGGQHGWSANATDKKATPSDLTVKLANFGGALPAAADFYTWGLSDGKDVSKDSGGSGYDLRAAGVQSFDSPDGKFLVFAVNNHDRWSSPATQEFDVSIDTTGDGVAEYVVFTYDSGAFSTGDYNGILEVYVYDVAAKEFSPAGYYPVAPTDSSTILLPVTSKALGLTAASGPFAYTVSSFTGEDSAASDEFTGWATYDPWAKAISDGAYETVARNGKVTVPVTIDPAKFAAQKPEGVMVVVFDNKSGQKESLLLGVR